MINDDGEKVGDDGVQIESSGGKCGVRGDGVDSDGAKVEERNRDEENMSNNKLPLEVVEHLEATAKEESAQRVNFEKGDASPDISGAEITLRGDKGEKQENEIVNGEKSRNIIHIQEQYTAGKYCENADGNEKIKNEFIEEKNKTKDVDKSVKKEISFECSKSEETIESEIIIDDKSGNIIGTEELNPAGKYCENETENDDLKAENIEEKVEMDINDKLDGDKSVKKEISFECSKSEETIESEIVIDDKSGNIIGSEELNSAGKYCENIIENDDLKAENIEERVEMDKNDKGDGDKSVKKEISFECSKSEEIIESEIIIDEKSGNIIYTKELNPEGKYYENETENDNLKVVNIEEKAKMDLNIMEDVDKSVKKEISFDCSKSEETIESEIIIDDKSGNIIYSEELNPEGKYCGYEIENENLKAENIEEKVEMDKNDIEDGDKSVEKEMSNEPSKDEENIESEIKIKDDKLGNINGTENLNSAGKYCENKIEKDYLKAENIEENVKMDKNDIEDGNKRVEKEMLNEPSKDEEKIESEIKIKDEKLGNINDTEKLNSAGKYCENIIENDDLKAENIDERVEMDRNTLENVDKSVKKEISIKAEETIESEIIIDEKSGNIIYTKELNPEGKYYENEIENDNLKVVNIEENAKMDLNIMEDVDKSVKKVISHDGCSKDEEKIESEIVKDDKSGNIICTEELNPEGKYCGNETVNDDLKIEYIEKKAETNQNNIEDGNKSVKNEISHDCVKSEETIESEIIIDDKSINIICTEELNPEGKYCGYEIENDSLKAENIEEKVEMDKNYIEVVYKSVKKEISHKCTKYEEKNESEIIKADKSKNIICTVELNPAGKYCENELENDNLKIENIEEKAEIYQNYVKDVDISVKKEISHECSKDEETIESEISERGEKLESEDDKKQDNDSIKINENINDAKDEVVDRYQLETKRSNGASSSGVHSGSSSPGEFGRGRRKRNLKKGSSASGSPEPSSLEPMSHDDYGHSDSSGHVTDTRLTIEECSYEKGIYSTDEEEHCHQSYVNPVDGALSNMNFSHSRTQFPEFGGEIVEVNESTMIDIYGDEEGAHMNGSMSGSGEIYANNNSWEENWLFKRKKIKPSQSVPVPMLIPNANTEYRAMIGDRDAGDTSDLSEAGSSDTDDDDASSTRGIEHVLVASKTIIGGKNPDIVVAFVDEQELLNKNVIENNRIVHRAEPNNNNVTVAEGGNGEIKNPHRDVLRGFLKSLESDDADSDCVVPDEEVAKRSPVNEATNLDVVDSPDSNNADSLENQQQEGEYIETVTIPVQRHIDSLKRQHNIKQQYGKCVKKTHVEEEAPPLPSTPIPKMNGDNNLFEEFVPLVLPSEDDKLEIEECADKDNIMDVQRSVEEVVIKEETNSTEVIEPLVETIPGSIAEREHKKWLNAVPMANNPYSPEAIQSRLQKQSQKSPFDFIAKTPAKTAVIKEIKAESPTLQQVMKEEIPSNIRYGRDYYINEAKRATGARKIRSDFKYDPQSYVKNDDSNTPPNTPSTEIPEIKISMKSKDSTTMEDVQEIFAATPITIDDVNEQFDEIYKRATKFDGGDQDIYILPINLNDKNVDKLVQLTNGVIIQEDFKDLSFNSSISSDDVSRIYNIDTGKVIVKSESHDNSDGILENKNYLAKTTKDDEFWKSVDSNSNVIMKEAILTKEEEVSLPSVRDLAKKFYAQDKKDSTIMKPTRKISREVLDNSIYIKSSQGFSKTPQHMHSLTARSISKEFREELKLSMPVATNSHPGGSKVIPTTADHLVKENSAEKHSDIDILEPGFLKSKLEFFERLKND